MDFSFSQQLRLEGLRRGRFSPLLGRDGVDACADLPLEGEIGSVDAFAITAETAADVAAREALLDRAMGPGRKRKSSEKLRRGRKPSEGLAFAARGADGRVVGTVRLWDRGGSAQARSALRALRCSARSPSIRR